MVELEVGGNHLCILLLFLYSCMRNEMHNAYIVTSYTYVLDIVFCLNDIFVICICLGRASLEVSFLFIYNNSICSVIIKKGENVGPKSICPTFDDNKTYEVMFSNNFI